MAVSATLQLALPLAEGKTQDAVVLHQKTEEGKFPPKLCFCSTKMLLLSWFLSF